jgi:hypothetical protein
MIDWWFARERLLEENERLRRELSSNEKLRIRLTHELNSVNTELDNLHEAYDQCAKNLEKEISERTNMRIELELEEIRSAEFQGKFQRLETAMKSALGIRS